MEGNRNNSSINTGRQVCNISNEKADLELLDAAPKAPESIKREASTEQGVSVDEQIQELNDRFTAQLEAHKKNCESLESENRELKIKIGKVEDKLKDLTEDMEIVQADLSAHRTDINDISDNLKNLSAFKKTYKTDLEIIDNNHDILRKRVTDLEEIFPSARDHDASTGKRRP